MGGPLSGLPGTRDFKRNRQARRYVGQFFRERDFNSVLGKMPHGIWLQGSLENWKNPKPGTALHDTRRDQNVLVVLEINLVLPRNSLSMRQRKVGHLSLDSNVDRSLAQGHTAQVQHSPIEFRPVFAEMPEARLGDYSSEYHSLTEQHRISHRQSGAGFRLQPEKCGNAITAQARQ